METTDLKNKMIMVWMMWIAMLLSLAVYAGVCHLLVIFQHYEGGVGPDFPHELMKSVLFGLSLFQFVLIYFQRKIMLKPMKGGGESSPVGRYSVASLISWAIAESIGIYGMVLFLLKPDFQILYVFVALSAIAMIVYRPKTKELKRMVSETDATGY